jgi:hypothetical protein
MASDKATCFHCECNFAKEFLIIKTIKKTGTRNKKISSCRMCDIEQNSKKEIALIKEENKRELKDLKTV